MGVRLDYYQQRGARRGDLWRQIGRGLDTASQIVFDPSGNIITAHRSWKNGNGLEPRELLDIAAHHPGRSEPDESGMPRRDLLRLSWFLVDPEAYARDVIDIGAAKLMTRDDAPLIEARKVRRPLARVEGAALGLLEEHQEFLKRHVRQFWWQKGRADGPSRIVLLDCHDCGKTEPSELTGKGCSKERVPRVLGAVEIREGFDLGTVSPALDAAWRDYMTRRPSNASNLTFAKDQIPVFEKVDERIRDLAREGKLLAPGGRKLLEAPARPAVAGAEREF